ncbi:MAG: UbiD family decarboxylase [Rhodospirillales bacterium]
MNTWGCIVARTPDGGWTNWSIARMMVLDGKRMSGIVSPNQHIGTVAQAWADIGKPMPFALALGVEPSIPFICGMPLPDHVNEADRLGALMQRPIRTGRCRTIDLDAPASAEILVEGYLHRDELADEGPMGEFAGYVPVEPAMRRPVHHVQAVSHRTNAILPSVAACEPVEENHTAWGIPTAAQILHELRAAGIPRNHGVDSAASRLALAGGDGAAQLAQMHRHRRDDRAGPAYRRSGVLHQGRRGHSGADPAQ